MIYKILDKLYVGDKNYSKEDLKKDGISYVINLCGAKTGLESIHIHIADDNSNPDCMFHDILHLIREKIKTGYRILVHCREGRSRSSYIAALWLESCGFSWQDALEYVKSKNPKTDIELLLLKSHDQDFV